MLARFFSERVFSRLATRSAPGKAGRLRDETKDSQSVCETNATMTTTITADQVSAALAKLDNPAARGMLAQMTALQATLKKDVAPQTFQATSQKIKGMSNAVCVLAKVLDAVERDTKGPDGRGGKMSSYLFLTLDNGDRTQIAAETGRRDEHGNIWIRVIGEQLMTEEQQAAYAKEKEEARKGKKGASTGAQKKKHTFKLGESKIGLMLRCTTFEPLAIHPGKRAPFAKGDIVLISGPQPKQKYKPNVDLNVHDPDYGIQWTFASLLPDPYEDDPLSANLNAKAGDWGVMMESTYILNMWKGPGGGWSPDYMTDQDRAFVKECEENNTIDKHRSKIAMMGLSPENREHRDDLVIIPLFQTAEARQPFHAAKRRFVRFNGVAWGTEWVEKFNGPNNTTTEAAKADLQCIAQVFHKKSTTEVEEKKALVQMTLNARFDEIGFANYGIVRLDRWRNLASVYMPYVSGYVIGQQKVEPSEMLPVNQPMQNVLLSTGEWKLKANYGVQCYQFYHAPDLSSIILSPTAFPINLRCTKALMRAALGYDNPAAQALSAEASKNPLNRGSRNVINVFETSDRPENLTDEYNFYVIYAADKSSIVSIQSTRSDLKRSGKDPVETWSAIFESVKEDPARELFGFNSMPMPRFFEKENVDKFCVFAVRKTEVERVLAGPSELPIEEFVERMLAINAEEEAKYGPLPEGPPSADAPPQKRPATAAAASDDATTTFVPIKKPAAAKRARRGRTAGADAAAATAAADDGEGGASQASQADEFFEQ